MRIAHTADWHIGKVVNGFSMLEDQEYTLMRMIDQLKEEKVEALIMAGDLYDRSNPSKESVALSNRLFHRIYHELQIPFFVIAGNHDSPDRIEYGRDFFSSHAFYFEGTIKKQVRKVSFEDVDFWLIPFSDPVNARHVLDHDKIKSYEDLASYQVETIKNQMDKARINILIFHGYIVNGDLTSVSASDSERPLSIGTADYIQADIFDVFDYVALGHLHQRQHVKDERIRYSGSPLKYSKSEAHHKKGFDIIDITKDSIEIKTMMSEVKYDLIIKRGSFSDIMESTSQDYVFIELEDEGYQLNAMQKLRKNYPRIMGLEYVNRKEKTLQQSKLTKKKIKKSNMTNLFSDFYYEAREKRLSADKEKVVNNLVQRIQKEQTNEAT